MARLSTKIAVHRRMLRRGDIAGIIADYWRWTRSDELGSGYRVGLQNLAPCPAAKIDFTFRPVTSADVDRAFDTTGMTRKDAKELDARWRLWRSGIPTCYGGFVENGDAAFLGWAVLGRTHREALRRHFAKSFLPVRDDELLLEGSWVHPNYRGLALSVPAMHAVVSTGIDIGVVRVVTYVADDNPASWVGVCRLGFKRFVSRRTSWRFLRCHVVWTDTDVELERPSR